MIEASPPTELRFSRTIRRLHLFVAILVTAQIVIGLIMTERTPMIFLAHQVIGLTIVGVVLIHWIWLALAEREQLSNMFPTKPDRWQAVLTDVTALLRGQAPPSGPRAGLPALVHGLGLLSLTAVATLGTIIFVIIHWGNIRSSSAHAIVDLHVFFAWLLIIYWVGHVGLAVTHEMKGERIFARTFSLKR